MRDLRSGLICALAATCTLIACGPPPRGGGGGGGDDYGEGGDAPGGGCPKGAERVYVIDQFSNKISSFDPSTKTFVDLGALPCQTMPGATPFSMGVDRTAVAWVLYNSGELFHVELLNALQCQKTSWAGANGLHVFGMGFSTDTAGGSTDSLFVGGGASQGLSSYTLAKLDTSSMTAKTIATEPDLPEMTGNSKGELWGYWAELNPPKVVQFDKTTGAALQSFPQPSLVGTNTGYAFAHWGGDYWIFLIKNMEPSSSVYQMDGKTGMLVSTTPAPGRTIVGAGVSTCAPVIIN